jgi:hypothetical protein
MAKLALLTRLARGPCSQVRLRFQQLHTKEKPILQATVALSSTISDLDGLQAGVGCSVANGVLRGQSHLRGC